MLTAEPKTASTATRPKAGKPFLLRKGEGSFFDKSERGPAPFFLPSGHYSVNKDGILQTKYNVGLQKGNFIQRQAQPEVSITKEMPSNPIKPVTNAPNGHSARVNKCYTHPEFPDIQCLIYALKLDIDENLWNNAYHFYSVASLHPGNSELMWETFMRYGLGVNLLETSFGFAGTDKTLGKIFSYGTGIGLKSYEFLQNGTLQLDIPIPLKEGINLDLRLDLNADPDNLTHINDVNTSIGISGHF